MDIEKDRKKKRHASLKKQETDLKIPKRPQEDLDV